MAVGLKFDGDAERLEESRVDVVAPGEALVEDGGADGEAGGHEPFRRAPLHAQRPRQDAVPLETEKRSEGANEEEVEIEQPLPVPAVRRLDPGDGPLAERRGSVVLPDGLEMLPAPGRSRIDPDVADQRAPETVRDHRHREPRGAL